MPINADKPHLWKADVEKSIDFYNDWFLRFAPETYRKQRAITAEGVAAALAHTGHLKTITPETLKANPGILPMLRMACAPPIARDRLMGLAYLSKNLILSMEGKPGQPSRIPPKMPEQELDEHLQRICEILYELADRDLFPWLDSENIPDQKAIERAATVVADRLCGSTADPIIRNAQEQRQLQSLQRWLESRGYEYIPAKEIGNVCDMRPGTFTFRMNIAVGKGARKTNIPIDAVIQPANTHRQTPVLIEAKSAGDATNTNKRRKEEAQKHHQLNKQFGKVDFILYLCGYFEPGYLGYEAAEGIDWVWEHRISDFAELLGNAAEREKVEEAAAVYAGSNEKRERDRFEQQRRIDISRSQRERNALGQFSTPFPLALDIVTHALKLLGGRPIDFLEPSIGTGVFFSALNTVAPASLASATGIEIDAEYAHVAQSIWAPPYRTFCDDFILFSSLPEMAGRFNLICANPPYVRHHHIDGTNKRMLQQRVENELGMRVSGLSGLYVYFILLAHSLLKEGAVASWLIPSEFMSVNYGSALREYLVRHVTLLQIHRFSPDDVQFDDALVSSCIVTYRKQKPPSSYTFDLTSGGALRQPNNLQEIHSGNRALDGKWSVDSFAPQTGKPSIRVGDLFDIKRGIATGANGFFIVNRETVEKYGIPKRYLKPLLPGPRHLDSDVIEDAGTGDPAVERVRYLIDCDDPPEALQKESPGFWTYLQEGVERGISGSYICSHRKLWYQQEKRTPPLFFITYMGRTGNNGEGNPFRFILNRSNAIATNVYIYLYPRPFLKKLLAADAERTASLHRLLNGIGKECLIQNGRTYGGGLHKLEPKELAGLPLADLPEWLWIEKKTQAALPLEF